MARRLAAVALFAAQLTASAARADEPPPMKPETRALMEHGLELFRAREYEAAIREFERSFAIEERPELLFAMAQAERLSGDCATAVLLYRRFLATGPQATHAEAVRQSLAKCERALASRPGLAAGEPKLGGSRSARAKPRDDHLPAAPAATRGEPSAARDDREPWYRDPVGASLLAAGVTGLGAGAALFAMSASDAATATDSDSYVQYRELMDRAESRRTMAWLGLGAGSALALGAAVRYWLDDEDVEVAVSASADTAGVFVGARF